MGRVRRARALQRSCWITELKFGDTAGEDRRGRQLVRDSVEIARDRRVAEDGACILAWARREALPLESLDAGNARPVVVPRDQPRIGPVLLKRTARKIEVHLRHEPGSSGQRT